MRRFLSLAMIAALLGVTPAGSAVADEADDLPATAGADTVTICHRTNSVANPYIALTVAESSVDGNQGHHKGKGDHYENAEHAGPVFDATVHENNGDDWGDIIPPIPTVHDGRNWNEQGRAIYNNGCEPAPALPWFEDADSDGFGNPTVSVVELVPPVGYVSDSTDCDDNAPDINPGAAEVLGNGIDDDCDGVIDEGT